MRKILSILGLLSSCFGFCERHRIHRFSKLFSSTTNLVECCNQVNIFFNIWSSIISTDTEISVVPYEVIDADGIYSHLKFCQKHQFGHKIDILCNPERKLFLLNSASVNSEMNLPEKSVDEIDSSLVLDVSKKWVNGVMSGLGVCPFTIDSNRAGNSLPRRQINQHAHNNTLYLTQNECNPV